MSLGGDDSGAVGASSFVRPYVLSGGRTRGGTDLAIEAMVVTTGTTDRTTRLGPESAQILEHCAVRALSIAEVAGSIGVPLGVARVLVGDLAAAGALSVHDPGATDDVALIRRLIDAVREL